MARVEKRYVYTVLKAISISLGISILSVIYGFRRSRQINHTRDTSLYVNGSNSRALVAAARLTRLQPLEHRCGAGNSDGVQSEVLPARLQHRLSQHRCRRGSVREDGTRVREIRTKRGPTANEAVENADTASARSRPTGGTRSTNIP